MRITSTDEKKRTPTLDPTMPAPLAPSRSPVSSVGGVVGLEEEGDGIGEGVGEEVEDCCMML